MECTWYHSLLWSSLLVVSSLLLRWFRSRTHGRPPGPPGWPIIGNMLDLGTVPHRSLYNLRLQYGPVLWLKLGSINTMVVQSAKTAADLFKNHDKAFCDRTCPQVLTAHGYNNGSLAVSRYDEDWRALRRLCSSEMLVGKRVSDAAPLRRKCVDDMVRCVVEKSEAAVARGETGEVDLPRILFLVGFNVVGNLTLSKDLLDSRSENGGDFFDAMCKVMEWAGTPNVADFMPWLKLLDPQGLKKKMMRDMGTALTIIAGFLKNRIDEKQNSSEGTESMRRDFLEAVLEYQRDRKESSHEMSDQNLILIILEMFFAGSETTSSTLEWGMTELLRCPEVMRNGKEELDRVIGKERKVEESDFDRLPYFQAVVKEVLRLHPPIPLLLPRNTLEDTKFMGYMIPKNTQVFVNAWAIGRDPDAWEDPLSFKPERFLGSKIEYKGQNYEFIPFGSGRRMCVGMALAEKVLQLALASLVHSFEWELPDNLSPDTIDMNDRLGITVRKLMPLKVIPKKRTI